MCIPNQHLDVLNHAHVVQVQKCRLGSAWIDPFAHCLSAFLKLSTSAFSFPDGLSVNRICVIAKVPPVILTLGVVATSRWGSHILIQASVRW